MLLRMLLILIRKFFNEFLMNILTSILTITNLQNEDTEVLDVAENVVDPHQ